MLGVGRDCLNPVYIPLKKYTQMGRTSLYKTYTMDGQKYTIKAGTDGYRALEPMSDKTKYVRLRCGRCINCRAERASEWTTRILMEKRFMDMSLDTENNSCFVTLTYRPEEETWKSIFESKDGELHEEIERGLDTHIPVKEGRCQSVPTLYYEDFQSFNKRCRKNFKKHEDKTYKFYMCGEYGTNNTCRPHFHCILLGMNQQEADKYVREAWPHGFITIESVNFNTIAYVAGYVNKKIYKPVADQEYGEQTREFQRCSQGLGLNYFENLIRYNQVTEEKPTITLNGYERPIPRYFQRKMRDESWCNSAGLGAWSKMTLEDLYVAQINDKEDFFAYLRDNNVDPKQYFFQRNYDAQAKNNRKIRELHLNTEPSSAIIYFTGA